MLTVLMVLLAAPTVAQEPAEVLGTADFRNAPTLGSGGFRDAILTGEEVWYSVIYRNDTPFRLAVSLADPDGAGLDRLDLRARFVSPTLGSPSSADDVIEGRFTFNGGETNLWYIAVSLATEGRLGIEHDFTFDIVGVEASGFAACDETAGCSLDEELVQIEMELADAEAQIEAANSRNGDDLLQAQIADLDAEILSLEQDALALESRRDAAVEARRQAELSISLVCAPAAICEEATSGNGATSPGALAIGLIAFAVGLAAAVGAIRGRPHSNDRAQ